MDNDRRRCVAKGVQGDELLFNRIISRNSSVGCSSRIYYYRSSEGIPFNWETQPGTPKESQKEDILPPISPPPAVLSLGLPKPRINIEEPKPSMKLISSDDGEFMASPRMSSSSSSSSFSFSNGLSFRSSRLPSPSGESSLERHYGCSPLNFSSILVRVSRSRRL
ncbi:hypothetical protein REPUB_Repub18cG0039000 [Reevesia pubescens]